MYMVQPCHMVVYAIVLREVCVVIRRENQGGYSGYVTASRLVIIFLTT